MRVARSSSDQCETGVPVSAGLVVARTRTLWRSSGGKSGRAAAAWQVVQAVEALLAEAAPPAGDGGGVTGEFGGHLVVGGLGVAGAVEDDAGAEGQALRRGAGMGQVLEVVEFLVGQVDARCFASHGTRSVCQKRCVTIPSRQRRRRTRSVQALKCTR